MSPLPVSRERLRLAALSTGWQIEYATTPHDEDTFIKDMPPLRLEVYMQFRELPREIVVAANGRLSRQDFSAIVDATTNEPRSYSFPLEIWTLTTSTDPSLTQLEDILGKQLAASEMHAAGFDWNAKLEHFVNHRPDTPGTLQLAHLAALAFKGDLIKLLDYQDAFAKGKRLNFVPMITADMIDRAVDIAALR